MYSRSPTQTGCRRTHFASVRKGCHIQRTGCPLGFGICDAVFNPLSGHPQPTSDHWEITTCHKLPPRRRQGDHAIIAVESRTAVLRAIEGPDQRSAFCTRCRARWRAAVRRKGRQLISQDKVAVGDFGCWTSVSRKSVLPVSRNSTACCSTRPVRRRRAVRRTCSTPAPRPTSRRFRRSTT